MKSKALIQDLTQGSAGRQLIVFSIPLMVSNLLQTFYTVADMFIIGQFAGNAGLAAISISGQLLLFFTMICMGFSSAGQIIIAQYVGAENIADVRRSIETMGVVIVMAGVALGVVAVVGSEGFLRLLNTPAESFEEARRYTLVCGCGMVFIYGYNAVSAILRGLGNSRLPMVFICVATAINIALDLVLVAGFRMGCLGAALATVIGQAAALVLSLAYLWRSRKQLLPGLSGISLRVHVPSLKRLVRLGAPMALQTGAINISLLFISSYVNAFGPAASAVSGIGQKLFSTISIVTHGVGTAASTMIGQALGAGMRQRVRQLVRLALVICLSACAVFCLVLNCFPEEIIGRFGGDAQAQALAGDYLKIQTLAYVASALMVPGQALINGQGFASFSLAVALIDGVAARISLSLLLGLHVGLGIYGFWLGDALAGYCTVLLAGGYYLSGLWYKKKIIIDSGQKTSNKPNM